MTSDDVLEAMARGGGLIDAMARAAYGAMGFVDPWDSLVPHVKAKWRRAQLDALRAVTARGGLVVGKMPEDAVCTDDAGDQEWAWVNGCNHGYAAVRAAAVEVEP